MTTQTVNFTDANTWDDGVLPAGGVATANASGAPMPMTLTLESTAVGRAIAISVDGGTNFFTAPYDAVETNFLALAILAPISAVRFTGAQGDAWSIR